mmetsp:Transcript_24108/g.28224  ORF Transcript_24108/g.28224 Transcript_24108/m.28224 type:complete len:103 (+) Transcript_24108:620-928(+)
MMKKQLENREKGLDDKIEELREQCEDQSENIDHVNKQLLDLNKGNLKKTYMLEDLQQEYDMMSGREDGGSLFMTANSRQMSSHKTLTAQRESYATIARASQG